METETTCRLLRRAYGGRHVTFFPAGAVDACAYAPPNPGPQREKRLHLAQYAGAGSGRGGGAKLFPGLAYGVLALRGGVCEFRGWETPYRRARFVLRAVVDSQNRAGECAVSLNLGLARFLRELPFEVPFAPGLGF